MKPLIMRIFMISVLFFTVHPGVSLPLHAADNISRFEKEIKGILSTVSPSIVKVSAENHKKYIAAGIAIERNYVVSSIMVIRQRYRDIYIETVEGNKLPARVVGKDNESSLILLKTDKSSLTPIRWAGNYDVGDWVAVVGLFYDEFPAIYQGIVSSAPEDELLVNAPVAPGSSGSAVVNKQGELVGMVRGRFGFAVSPDYIYKDHSSEIFIQGSRNKSESLCYVVPAKKVKAITHDLKKYGKVKRGWLGVVLTPGKDGVKIARVVRESPAAVAGIRKDDEVLKVDGKSVRQPLEVSRIVKGLKPRQEVKLELLRGTGPQSVAVVIGEARPQPPVRTGPGVPGAGVEIYQLPEHGESLPKLENYVLRIGASRSLGIEIITLTPELAGEFDIKEGFGLMISKVYKNTAAEKAGFRPADIIVKAGNQKIETNTDLRTVLNQLEDDETLDIRVYRKGKLMKISVVPDKKKSAVFWFDRFRDKIKQLNIRVGDQDHLQLEDQEHPGNQKEVETYKQVIEKMRQERKKLTEEIERLKQLLEKKK